MGYFRGFAAAAALMAVVTSAPAHADTAAEATGSEAARVNPVGTGIAALNEILRPRARDGEEARVAVASRGAYAKEAVEAAKATQRALAARELDFATLDAIPTAKGDAEWQCLAEAIYFESRGEPLTGQVAVAEVILNRVRDRSYPGTICGVTKQGAGSGRACQFSYACDGRSDVMKSPQARARSEKLATLMLAGRTHSVTDGATHFHTRAVRPGWARKMTRTAGIGHHLFYRPASRVASN
jgi:spore germination cell wall hydrolase CwlJ-like protein